MSELDWQRAIAAAGDRPFASDTPVVYFVQAGDAGPIKIGFSRKFAGVRARVMGNQTGCPWPLVIRRVMEAQDVSTEAELHNRFSRARLAGEWFHPTAELAEFANAVASRDDADVRMLREAFDRGFKIGREYGAQEAGAWFAKDLRAFSQSYKHHEEEFDLEREKRDAIDGLRRAA